MKHYDPQKPCLYHSRSAIKKQKEIAERFTF
nr:MAG TPA_asm: hypothetical protein [Caudoviricetes sp.]